MIKRAKTKKNIVPVSANLEENPVDAGNFSKLVLPRIKPGLQRSSPGFGAFQDNINSLQGNKNSSCSSALRGENYPETSSEPAPNLFRGQVFETSKGKKIRVVEVYGNKPIDEVLEAFSKYISQFFKEAL